MADKRLLKTALIISVAMLLLCIAAAAGTTWAWFTDYTSSGLNTIQVGTLDVELEYSYDGESWHDVRSHTGMFDKNASWLPGHSQHVYLRVSNRGSLALKYQLSMNILEERESINMLGRNYKLSHYMKVGALSSEELAEGDTQARLNAGDKTLITSEANTSFTDTVKSISILQESGYSPAQSTAPAGGPLYEAYLSPGEADIVALIVRMPEELDKEINYPTGINGPKLIFGIDVIAGQQMKENDSFGDDYDKDATYPEIGSPALLEELKAAGGFN